MKLVVKEDVDHVNCIDFPRNVSSAKQLFEGDEKFKEYNQKFESKIKPTEEGMS